MLALFLRCLTRCAMCGAWSCGEPSLTQSLHGRGLAVPGRANHGGLAVSRRLDADIEALPLQFQVRIRCLCWSRGRQVAFGNEFSNASADVLEICALLRLTPESYSAMYFFLMHCVVVAPPSKYPCTGNPIDSFSRKRCRVASLERVHHGYPIT